MANLYDGNRTREEKEKWQVRNVDKRRKERKKETKMAREKCE